MKTYRVADIAGFLEMILDEEVEAENEEEAREQIYYEIIDNIGNYIEIELEEVK